MTTRFKTPGRKSRIMYPEGSFSKGMQYSEGFLDANTVKLLVNYRVMDSGSYLTPRKGITSDDYLVRRLTTSANKKFPAPHVTYSGTYFSSQGNDVHGFIIVSFGVPTDPDYEYYYTKPGDAYFNQTVGGGVGFVGMYLENGQFISVNAGGCNFNVKCTFYKNEPKPIFTVHDSELYFINDNKISKLLIEWNDEFLEYQARIEVVTGKEVNLTEATTIGFNMFDDDPYSFANDYDAIVLNIKGILPYRSDENTLKLSANLGETILFKLFYSGVAGQTYRYRWEMAYFGSNVYTVLEDYLDHDPISSTNQDITLRLTPDVSKFVLRCIVVPINATTGEMDDILSKVGIYPVYELGITDLLDVSQSDNYDLGSATGMCEHSGMMVLWGIHGVEKTLFLSDGPDAEYFPYPNNTFTFPDNILKVVSFSGSLLVFTARKLYYVEGYDIAEMYGPYSLFDNVDFTQDDMETVLGVNNGLLVRMNGMLYILAKNSYTGKIGDTKLVNISGPVLDIMFDFPKFIRLLSDRLYKFDVNWGEYTRIEQYDFVNFVDNGRIKNIYRFVVYEELNNVLKRFQIDVILVYDSYGGSWTVETASFPYNGLAASGSNLYSSYAKIGAIDTEVYLQKLAFDSSYCEDRYNSMFYGEAINDMVDPTREAFYQSLSSGLAYVRRVVDGDTLVIYGIAGAVDTDITVRFNYINTPESTTSVEPYGMEASYFLSSLYNDLNPDIPIYIEFDSNTTIDRSDRYGRMLAWLWTTIEVDGEWVKDQLIQVLIADRGYIKSYYDFGCVDYVAAVEAAVAHAVENKVGLYANLQTDGPYYIRTAQSNDIVGNFQILDTGNRNQDPFMEKRYKEIQIMMSNDSTDVLEFYLEFFIDSIKRRTYSSYSIDQITDINASDYGTIYVVENEDPDIILGNETAMSFWQLDFSVFPELEIVKVVYKITGRGHYPRVVLVSRNENNYRIIDYAWVFRTMNGR